LYIKQLSIFNGECENFAAATTDPPFNYVIACQSEARDSHVKTDFWLGICMSAWPKKITPPFDVAPAAALKAAIGMPIAR
jgi:hypothetical protein